MSTPTFCEMFGVSLMTVWRRGNLESDKKGDWNSLLLNGCNFCPGQNMPIAMSNGRFSNLQLNGEHMNYWRRTNGRTDFLITPHGRIRGQFLFKFYRRLAYITLFELLMRCSSPAFTCFQICLFYTSSLTTPIVVPLWKGQTVIQYVVCLLSVYLSWPLFPLKAL